jgi:hypothetical protein
MGQLDAANTSFRQVFHQLQEDRYFLLLSSQLAYTINDRTFAKQTLNRYFDLEGEATHINAHYLSILLEDGDSSNNLAKPKSLDWVFFENFVTGKNSVDYILSRTNSASLTFFMAQVAKANADSPTEKRLLETTLERAVENTPEYLCAHWQLKALEN